MDADTESIEVAEDIYYEDHYDAAIDHSEDERDDHFGWESLGIALGLGEEITTAEQPLRSPEQQKNKLPRHQDKKLPLSARREIEDTSKDLTKPTNWLTKLGNVKYHLDRKLTDKEREALEIASDISDILKSEREFNRIDAEHEEAEQKAKNQRKELSNLKIINVGRKLLEKHRKTYG